MKIVWNLEFGSCKLRNQGFSLIELIFAMLFLTVIVMGVVKIQTSNLALSKTTDNELKAYFLAHQGIEIVEALGKNALCTSTSPCSQKITISGNTYNLSEADLPETIDGTFERTIEVSEDAAIPNAKKVTVLIEWVDSTGEHRRDVGNDAADASEYENAHVEVKKIIFN